MPIFAELCEHGFEQLQTILYQNIIWDCEDFHCVFDYVTEELFKFYPL